MDLKGIKFVTVEDRVEVHRNGQHVATLQAYGFDGFTVSSPLSVTAELNTRESMTNITARCKTPNIIYVVVT